MAWFDLLKVRAARASPHSRTALLSECGVRVLPVYEEYWVGDHSVSVARSIEIGWAYALGIHVDAGELQSCLENVQDLVTYYYEDATRNEVLASTVTVVLRLLQSITLDREVSVLATARGIASTIDTAKCAEAMANWNVPREAQLNVAGDDQERAWQQAALARIESWTGAENRSMFDDLGAKPPAWLLNWLANCRF